MYFENEGNIGDRTALADAATNAGMDKETVQKFLASDELTDQVKAEASEWQRKYRIGGVPFFVIDGKYKVEGAQEAETFAGIFEEISARTPSK